MRVYSLALGKGVHPQVFLSIVQSISESIGRITIAIFGYRCPTHTRVSRHVNLKDQLHSSTDDGIASKRFTSQIRYENAIVPMRSCGRDG